MHDPAYVVTKSDACPNCGETHLDWLVWNDQDMIVCQTCKTEYDLVIPANAKARKMPADEKWGRKPLMLSSVRMDGYPPISEISAIPFLAEKEFS